MKNEEQEEVDDILYAVKLITDIFTEKNISLDVGLSALYSMIISYYINTQLPFEKARQKLLELIESTEEDWPIG